MSSAVLPCSSLIKPRKSKLSSSEDIESCGNRSSICTRSRSELGRVSKMEFSKANEWSTKSPKMLGSRSFIPKREDAITSSTLAAAPGPAASLAENADDELTQNGSKLEVAICGIGFSTDLTTVPLIMYGNTADEFCWASEENNSGLNLTGREGSKLGLTLEKVAGKCAERGGGVLWGRTTLMGKGALCITWL